MCDDKSRSDDSWCTMDDGQGRVMMEQRGGESFRAQRMNVSVEDSEKPVELGPSKPSFAKDCTLLCGCYIFWFPGLCCIAGSRPG